MPELVTLGETMVVFDSTTAGPLRYASNYTCHTGGAETTVAVGVVRQGHTAGWISSLGDDEFGMLVRRTFMGEGVDLSRVVTDPSRPTGIFFRQALGNGEYRKSLYYRIIGPEFIRLAFQFAHEADPDAELYYNDYGMDSPGKREGVVRMVKDLKEHGCRIDAVGMQSHVGFNTPLDEYEKSMDAFIAAGVKVMVTELDLSVLPWPRGNYGAAVETNFDYKKAMDPYTDGLPADKAKEQDDFYAKLFDIYLRHSKDLTRVTFWGVTDGDSWKNNFPVRGRTDYPLAFDRNMQPKPFVQTIIEMAESGKYDK